MTGLAIVFVLMAAVAHASWNLMVRRSETPELTNWLMVGSGAVVAAPIAVVVWIAKPLDMVGWLFITGTIALHIGYFFTLGRAYKYGDLSVVYPVARGLGLVLIPLIGVTVLTESVSMLAAVGITAIFIGVITVGSSSSTGMRLWSHPGKLLADRGLIFAVITGVLIATYSTFDKRGVDHVEPVLYMFMLQLGSFAGLVPLLGREYTVNEFTQEIRSRWKLGLVGGALQFLAYGLVLSAFRLSPVSYVGPFRELGIVFGVIMAALILKESITLKRGLGAVAIGTGAILVAIAP